MKKTESVPPAACSVAWIATKVRKLVEYVLA
jgi:hypothetical protein